ncbi:MAG: DUF4876 domain-containing protein [Bacteroidales bacterium]|nr:DUF4876 domain-containing protein [Bacteroidales bacterium]
MKGKVIALAVAALASALTAAQAEDAVAPAKGNIVISKVYYSQSNTVNKTTGKTTAYTDGQFIELYNNSDKAVDVKDLYVGLGDFTTYNAGGWTTDRLRGDEGITYAEGQSAHPGCTVLKQIFKIKKSKVLAPGETLLLVNSAIDHTAIVNTDETENPYECDLTGADFEAKDLGSAKPKTNNDNVEEIENVYTYSANFTFIQIAQAGPSPIVLFTTEANIGELETTTPFNNATGLPTALIQNSWVIDGVELESKAVHNSERKYLADEIDKGGQICTSRIGERFMRKAASVTEDGRLILQDTDNSTEDFVSSLTIGPRAYTYDIELTTSTDKIENAEVGDEIDIEGVLADASFTEVYGKGCLKYSSSDETVGTMDGSVLKIVGEGETTVTISVESKYLNAESVTVSVKVEKAKPTNIETVESNDRAEKIYDLSGREVKNPKGGLYVVGGKLKYVSGK